MTLLQNVATHVAGEATNAVGQSFGMINKVVDFAVSYAPKILGAVIFYIIGSWIIKKIVNIMGSLMSRKSYEPSLQSFLMSLVKIVLMLFLFITIMGILGVDTTVFAGALAGGAIAVGAALNGSLGNFAGGVMMLIFKPFKIGEMIEAQGITGIVTEQGIFNTTVLTADNKTVIVPNGPLSTGIITNYTSHGNLRVDLTMAVDPNTKIEDARRVAVEAMMSHPKVLKTPAPEVSVLKVADGMISLAIRPYTTQADYWDVYFGAQELVKNAWDKAGIEGPTPHRVIINKTA
jgi:small conductance mechanosensitive channel